MKEMNCKNGKLYIVYDREGFVYGMTYNKEEAVKMFRRMNEEENEK